MSYRPLKLSPPLNRLLALALLLVMAVAFLPVSVTAAPAGTRSYAPDAQSSAPDAPSSATCALMPTSAASVADTRISQEKVDERKGTDPELRIKTENKKLIRSLLRFDLSSIPAGAVISSATLSLYVKDASGATITVNAHRVTQSWNEMEATWKARDKAANLLWANLGGDYDPAVAGTAVIDNTKNVWRSWTITGLVQGWASNPSSNLGVLLESPVADPKAEKKFKSSDDGTAAQRPKLEVCYSAGLTLEPDNSGDGVAGNARTYGHILRVGNIGPVVVNLSANSNRGWPTRIYQDVNGNGVKDPADTQISATPSIGPNVDYPILVQVDVPLSATPGASDVTTVTAAAQGGSETDTATNTTRIGRLIAITPAYERYATAGTTLFYGHTIFNNGPSQDCMTVSATSSQGWTVKLWEDLNGNGVHEVSNPNEPALSNPVCINPGKSYKLVAELTLPANAAVDTKDILTVRAQSGAQAGQFGSVANYTTVFVNTPPVIDGKYDQIYSISPDASEVCYNANGGTLFGKLASFYQANSDSVTFVLAIDKDFVDNTYGTNAVGWSGGHTFGNLTGSDHAQFYGYDSTGKLVLDFKVDYLTSTTIGASTPSGYASLGVTGGEGRMNLGLTSDVLAWGTSLDYSMNDTGYCSNGNCALLLSQGGVDLEVNSPATNNTYAPNPKYPNWIFDVIYEVQIKKSAFGAGGFGSMDVPYIHASPSKVGTNSIYAEPGPCPGDIGDTVWYDTNANGVQDPGETGIPNVQLKLYLDNGDGIFSVATDTLKGTATTNSTGNYLFQNLPAGDYFVDVVDSTVPAGYGTTTFNDPTLVINLAEGEQYLEADFGYNRGAAIGDYVWEDLDKDGVQDAGEPGLPGVTVNLYDGAGNLVGATTTDNTGFYSFPNRSAGNYQVGFVAPPNYAFTLRDAGGDDAKDSDPDPATGRTVIFTLAQDVPDLTRDAGLYSTLVGNATIGDRVWNDANGNGIQDSGETGRAGVIVRLLENCTNVVNTTTTSSLGIYSFTTAPGTYCIEFVAPAGTVFSPVHQGGDETKDSDADPTTGRTEPTFLSAGENDLTWDAGVSPTASVGDRVWKDTNVDGVQDAGEPGVVGVQVDLFTSTGDYVGTQYTDVNGVYLFQNVPAGIYYLQFSAPDGYAVSPQDQGGDDARDSDPNASGLTPLFSVVAGVSDITRDMGVYPVAAIGDYVWYDSDADGIQDPNEPPAMDIAVDLLDANGGIIDTKFTDQDGLYLFDGLVPGEYCLKFNVPANAAFTWQNQGGSDSLDSDANPGDGRTQCTVLSSGETDISWDAGLIPPGAIGDFVWYDANRDGIEDVGEPGIPNVTIDLYFEAEKVQSTVTDADGGYIFKNLGPGTYTVDITDVYGVLAELTHVLGGQSVPDPAPVSLGVGEVNKNIDFGYFKEPPAGKAIIGDTVWYDYNADGFQQPSEPGIPGIQVCATNTTNPQVVLCDTTDGNGHYLIEVPAGSYSVQPQNPPAGYTVTTLPVPKVFSVVDGQQYLDADFGYDSPSLGVIGNLVFFDANTPQGNGIYDGPDTPFPGVSVDLIRDNNFNGVVEGTDGNGMWDPGEPIIATVTTVSALDGNNGNYQFTGVPAGDYLVHVSDTNAVLIDYTKSMLGAAGVNNNNQLDPYAISLPAGATNLTADFGYEKGGPGDFGDPDGVIGNQIWIESDGNGLFNPLSGDFGQPGVSLELMKDGQPYATTFSGPSGRYAFVNLPPGSYTVNVSDTGGVLHAYHPTLLGPNPGQDHNNQGQPYQVILPLGGYNPTADFGYTQPGAIGDYVWYDTNKDGIQDVGEPGLGNVTMVLWRDANNNNTLETALDKKVQEERTGIDGGYLFTDLEPGVYFVDSDTKGVLGDLTHTLGNQSKTDPTGPISLKASEIYRDADFGYVKTVTDAAVIGDTVWYDYDADGFRDPGEPGIFGVQVCTTLSGGGAGPCDSTDSSGIYRIVVPPGTYTVAPTNPPSGYTATTPVPHGPVVVGPGDQYLDADFGYDSPNLGVIGGTVWNDKSEDGLLDADEPRLPSISVDLIRIGGDAGGTGGTAETNPLIATTTTDSQGNYRFEGLPPGIYEVQVSDTQNILDDFVDGPLGPNPGSDNNNQAQPYRIDLATGEIDTTADFGYVSNSRLGIIGNQVWYEEDGNGLYNPFSGDIGIAGVTVGLYQGGVLYDTTTTGASGDYVFTSLPAGSYTVRVTDTFGVLKQYVLTVLGPSPTADNNNQAQPYAVSIPAEGINMTADFGYTRPGAIGDLVWYDVDRDGVEDVGEPGIPNVTLDLYRSGVVIASTVTGADGGYLFPNLAPGVYVVDVTDLNNKLFGLSHMIANQSQPDPTAPITLDAGVAYRDADFGYVKIPNSGRGIIGDTVWYDYNADGFQQPGEPGIPGIEVCATVINSVTKYCQTTDGNGLYRIEVPAGSYNVQPTNPPAGYSATTSPIPEPVTIAAGQQYLDADFGYDSPNLGTIGNLVFRDANKDGIYNGTDSAFAGVSVDLIRDDNFNGVVEAKDGNGVWDLGEPIIATVTTGGALDGNLGNYLFTAVPAGRYLVHVSDTNAVLLDYFKSPLGAAGVNNQNQADPYAINLTTASNLTADFGYYPSDRPHIGVIGNQVWIEKDGDGIFDPANGDYGQHGVTVQLFRYGEEWGVTTTGPSGDYSFVGLPSGTYTVTVLDGFDVLAGYMVTTLWPGATQDNYNKEQPYQVVLPTDGYNLTADFGYTIPTSGIGDTVFYDDNGNGTEDSFELGIPGINVELYGDGVGGACTVLLRTMKTNEFGKYLFLNLPGGHYCVKVPETPDKNPFLGGFTRTAGTNPHEVNLANNQTYLLADFGYAGKGQILGQVWYDWSQDKVRGFGEDAIPGVTVCLYADVNNDGIKDNTTPVAPCTTTDAQGNYVFNNVLAGNYVVEETDPTGFVSSTPNTLGPDLILSQGSGFSANNDFGDLLFVRLGDFVFIDFDADGAWDPGTETIGIPNVQLTITGIDKIGRPVNVTLLTDETGTYKKLDLIPGNYTVSAPETFGTYHRTSPASRSTALTVSFTEDFTLDFGYEGVTGVGVYGLAATANASSITVTWNTIHDAPLGFKVWRSLSVDGEKVQVSDGVAAGTDGGFEFVDNNVTKGVTYWYWVQYPGEDLVGSVNAKLPSDSFRILLPSILR